MNLTKGLVGGQGQTELSNGVIVKTWSDSRQDTHTHIYIYIYIYIVQALRNSETTNGSGGVTCHLAKYSNPAILFVESVVKFLHVYRCLRNCRMELDW